MKIYECWEVQDWCLEVTLLPLDHPRHADLIRGGRHLYSIRASSWEDAVASHEAIQQSRDEIPFYEKPVYIEEP